ncbi:MAG TPA: hypothetical protein PKJ41_00475 [Bryobacteraceae bacterium]|nr:hypothetical protein [Bryobacteraceae bacterium]
MRFARLTLLTCLALTAIEAQVHSPKVLAHGQPDSTSLQTLAQGIYAKYNARTPRERAEAIWRFFLTDGRFVEPGFFYHIAGWAYEEPAGEVLDPLKLLNSYGFGLCYHIAPVLEAVWEAGGFEDARVWFLTGHTVAEVYYDGGYHHFDSDMLGYSTVGNGPASTSRVASVRELEQDSTIITGKLIGPRQSDPVRASSPWYPADVRAGAIPGLAEAFTSTSDNSLFPFQRSPHGHTMDFVLRPSERLIRYFQPEHEGLYYLPFKWDGQGWKEFPREIAEYNIRTENGPASQKDSRRWTTGRLEYRPPVSGKSTVEYEVRSPWVIIDAEFEFALPPNSVAASLRIETSTDGGKSWLPASTLSPLANGKLRMEPAVLNRSEHGRRTAVSGTYGYLVRTTAAPGAKLAGLLISTRIQLNPRTLPEIKPGTNQFAYSAQPPLVRRETNFNPADANRFAHHVSNARFVSGGGQGYWQPNGDGPAELVFRLDAPDGDRLSGISAGGRFLDLSRGLAPDKFTAEVRKVQAIPSANASASIAWSESPAGPFQTVWTYNPKLEWKDGDPIDRTLAWPEVDRHVSLNGARQVYVRYTFNGLAIDDFRLATEAAAPAASSELVVTHLWKEGTSSKSFTVTIPPGAASRTYTVTVPLGARIANEAIIFECPFAGKLSARSY